MTDNASPSDQRPGPLDPSDDREPTGNATATGPPELQPLPLDLHSPQFTLRAVLTGMLLGGLFSCCNIYLGLKIGLGLNMSISAALVGYGLWMALRGVFGVRHLGMLENNINQTACSSGASVASAGLIAPIPALTIMTGQTFSWHFLAIWVFSVCLVGIVVAIGLRRQMLLVEKLPFVAGVASAETLRELYAKGREASRRLALFIAAALVASPIQLLSKFRLPVLNWGLPRAFPLGFSIKGFSARSLGFGLDSTLLLYALGGLVGFRACASILIGTILAWGVLAPSLIHTGHLRLTTAESLDALPQGVELPPEPYGYATYEANRHRLTWKGVMTPTERAELLDQSHDPFFREVVTKLYLKSQLALSAQLDALPAGVTLPPNAPVSFDAAQHALMARRALDHQSYNTLLALSDAADYHNALNTLHQQFTTTTRRLPTTEPLLPAGTALPDKLADVVVYDPAANTIQVVGVLGDEQAQLLRTLVPEGHPAHDDFEATVRALLAQAAYAPPTPSYRDMIAWLLWPGVTLMVVASLTSLAFNGRAVLALFHRHQTRTDPRDPSGQRPWFTRWWFLVALAAVALLSVSLQTSVIHIVWWVASLGVILSFLLAVVAGRVSGETGITPVAAMGKVSQVFFGALTPTQVAPNLMAANVTGGAASQCADLLHDLKCGHLLGASPRLQSLAQVCGALAGALAGSAIYLVLIPDPGQQLITDEWAAPGVAGMKAVAELFKVGFEALPSGTPLAMLFAALAGLVLAVVEKVAPKSIRRYMISPTSLGLAFVIPAHMGCTMFVGATIALLLATLLKSWTKRFLITLCAGIIAGESLTGVGIALYRIATT